MTPPGETPLEAPAWLPLDASPGTCSLCESAVPPSAMINPGTSLLVSAGELMHLGVVLGPAAQPQLQKAELNPPSHLGGLD